MITGSINDHCSSDKSLGYGLRSLTRSHHQINNRGPADSALPPHHQATAEPLKDSRTAHYISERKEEVFAGFKKNKKAGAAEIPAATQLFTPHWIVRYLVENSLGRLWLLNRPDSRLTDQMDYYIAPVDEETDYLKVAGPEELKIIDPACGSGHMLTYAFDLLYAIYEEEGYAPSDIPGLILANNLYGTEIDPRAGALAAFALSMKGRARQRTFFTKQIEPNICVLEPVSFTSCELDALATGDDRADEEAFWNQFAHADTFGALSRPKRSAVDSVKQRFSVSGPADNGLFAQELRERAEIVIKQAEYLSQSYSVLIANPPYMGGKNMASRLAQYAKEEYPSTKSDLFSMFIERSFGMVAPGGYSAMVTVEAWMFLLTYKELRETIVTRKSIRNMVHMPYVGKGSTSMGTNFGTAATVIQNVADSRLKAAFQCVCYYETDSTGVPLTFPVINERYALLAPCEFTAVPDTRIAYWLSAGMLKAFSLGRPLAQVGVLDRGWRPRTTDVSSVCGLR
ncbi:Eco57I restriction-modification methylase domain-containing protein [Streptomyces sp. bgisy032]|uniref:Eco57I restriction-modification methylase domain-containing protein n=1 Tax=Streptomyces sp. bgisy032 TaxID=3413773 RepID=UPI003D723DC9